jgi:hypothetical protein
MLNKVIVVSSTIKPHEKSPEELARTNIWQVAAAPHATTAFLKRLKAI